jgi:hypothetical protein
MMVLVPPGLRGQRSVGAGVAAVALLAFAAISCRYSPITAVRIEPALAQTFANLVETQVSWMGLAPMASSEVGASAACRKAADTGGGSGEWVCTVIWRGPDGRSVRDTYDIFVGTDGCYTASVSGEALGGPMLTAKDGKNVRNLLYAFDGCFDTTS